MDTVILLTACISKYSAGCVHYYPAFHTERNTPMSDKFEADLRRYITRKIGFEAVMRIRCTRGCFPFVSFVTYYNVKLYVCILLGFEAVMRIRCTGGCLPFFSFVAYIMISFMCAFCQFHCMLLNQWNVLLVLVSNMWISAMMHICLSVFWHPSCLYFLHCKMWNIGNHLPEVFYACCGSKQQWLLPYTT